MTYGNLMGLIRKLDSLTMNDDGISHLRSALAETVELKDNLGHQRLMVLRPLQNPDRDESIRDSHTLISVEDLVRTSEILIEQALSTLTIARELLMARVITEHGDELQADLDRVRDRKDHEEQEHRK